LQERLYDLSIAINQGFGSTDTHTGRRAARLPFLINEFSKSPIIGGGESTGHVFWLDRLSMYGLIGIIPWILIITYQIKFNLKNLNKEFKFYYLISIIAFIALGFMKNMSGKEIFMSIFLIIPGLNYLDYLYKPQINKLKKNKYNYNLYANE
jgi:O-antigen ligase